MRARAGNEDVLLGDDARFVHLSAGSACSAERGGHAGTQARSTAKRAAPGRGGRGRLGCVRQEMGAANDGGRRVSSGHVPRPFDAGRGGAWVGREERQPLGRSDQHAPRPPSVPPAWRAPRAGVHGGLLPRWMAGVAVQQHKLCPSTKACARALGIKPACCPCLWYCCSCFTACLSLHRQVCCLSLPRRPSRE